jgi:hypothetical protein
LIMARQPCELAAVPKLHRETQEPWGKFQCEIWVHVIQIGQAAMNDDEDLQMGRTWRFMVVVLVGVEAALIYSIWTRDKRRQASELFWDRWLMEDCERLWVLASIGGQPEEHVLDMLGTGESPNFWYVLYIGICGIAKTMWNRQNIPVPTGRWWTAKSPILFLQSFNPPWVMSKSTVHGGVSKNNQILRKMSPTFQTMYISQQNCLSLI